MQHNKIKFRQSVIAPIFLSLSLLVGCSTVTKKPTPNDDKVVVEVTENEVNNLIKFNRELLLPPLDLTEYKSIQFNIITQNDKSYVVLQYNDYIKMMELLKVLENRIKEQKVLTDDILKFHEQRTNR